MLLSVLCVVSLVAIVNSQLIEGDPCRTATGDDGVCTQVSDCPQAEEQIRADSQPAVCSYEANDQPSVCCQRNDRAGVLTSGSRNSVSYKKCEEYSRVLDVNFTLPVLTVHTVKTTYSPCYIHAEGTHLIVGGDNASLNEFPHMAVLGFGPEDDISWKCGGTLISERFIMTAGHCLFDSRSGPGSQYVSWARLGDVNIASPEDDKHAITLRITRRIAHPNYTAPSHYNDIALLQLERNVNFSAALKPACIHDVAGYMARDLNPLVTGWGLTHSGADRTSDVLLKTHLKFVDNEVCYQAYAAKLKSKKLSRGIDSDVQMCAGDPEGKRDTCQGDSGGPIQLVLREPKCMYAVVGLTSFGPTNCGGSIIPAVYTRVKPFIPWIESVVWPNNSLPAM